MAEDERPNRIHQLLFGAMSLAGPKIQRRLLRGYFDLWHIRADPWSVTVDAYEREKYKATLDQVPKRDYGRVLDVGCSEGCFTMLASAAHPKAETVGADISHRALRRAREQAARTGSSATFVRLDILTEDARGPYDLIFVGELLYYLGNTPAVADRLAGLLEPGGHLVLTHSRPQARLLHTHFDGHPRLTSVSNEDGEHDGRFFNVAVYERT
ncbi:class I SAM-dependent methyltransferase [Nonomuraea endophytica]|uniref:class I SAM-dependent methyltransferase n=1 Tax=Nonomuraea endophytica TaxID=714136 RepID=UPI0037C5E4DC